MGVETNVSVGPVIKCKGPTQTIDMEKKRCPNPECKNHARLTGSAPKFCPVCGSEIETHLVPQPMDHWDIEEEEGIDENMFYVLHSENHSFGEDVEIYTDNQTSKSNTVFSPHHQDKPVVLHEGDIEKAVNAMWFKFAKEIAILQKYYKFVTVEYLVFTFFN